MQVARYQSLRRQAAGHGDNLDIQSFILIESQLFGDEMWIIDNSKTRKRNADIFKLRGFARHTEPSTAGARTAEKEPIVRIVTIITV